MNRFARGDEDARPFNSNRLIGTQAGVPRLGAFSESIRRDDAGLEHGEDVLGVDGGRRGGARRNRYVPSHDRWQRVRHVFRRSGEQGRRKKKGGVKQEHVL